MAELGKGRIENTGFNTFNRKPKQKKTKDPSAAYLKACQRAYINYQKAIWKAQQKYLAQSYSPVHSMFTIYPRRI